MFYHRQTDAPSLVMNGHLTLRLTPGMCLNFMMLMHETSLNPDEPQPPSAFSHFMSGMNLEPVPALKVMFVIIGPIVLLVRSHLLTSLLVFFSSSIRNFEILVVRVLYIKTGMFLFAFNIPKRVIALLGITRFESEATYDASLIVEGEKLIQREFPFFIRKIRDRRNSDAEGVRGMNQETELATKTASELDVKEQVPQQTAAPPVPPRVGLSQLAPANNTWGAPTPAQSTFGGYQLTENSEIRKKYASKFSQLSRQEQPQVNANQTPGNSLHINFNIDDIKF
jgi:hypothetical protein